MKMFEMETYKIFGDQEHSLIEMTLGDLLDKVASVYPENDCVVCNDKPFRKTYKEFKEEGKNLDKREGQTRRTNLRGKAPFDRKRTYDSDRRSDKTERFDRSGKPSFRRDSKPGKPIGKKTFDRPERFKPDGEKGEIAEDNVNALHKK